MSEFLETIIDLVAKGHVKISNHGYEELAADGLLIRDVIKGIKEAILVEKYPHYPKGPCVLVLQKDSLGQAFHVVWGIPQGHTSPAVLVTAYRPDLKYWDTDFLRRRN